MTASLPKGQCLGSQKNPICQAGLLLLCSWPFSSCRPFTASLFRTKCCFWIYFLSTSHLFPGYLMLFFVLVENLDMNSITTVPLPDTCCNIPSLFLMVTDSFLGLLWCQPNPSTCLRSPKSPAEVHCSLVVSVLFDVTALNPGPLVTSLVLHFSALTRS